MIKHIVMWKLKNQALDKSKMENAKKMKDLLEGLDGQIKGMLTIEVGININDSNAAYDIALYSEFSDMDALNGYQVNPKHLEVGEFISLIRDERIVIDYKV